MSTDLLYLRDAYLRDFEATVVDRREGAVALDRTAFYPTGGGQPHDTGTLSGNPVTDVRKEGEVVWHSVTVRALPDVGTSVAGAVDWDRRHALMRTHTALHVLCGVIWNEWRVPVTGGNMEPLAARMDFEFDPLPDGFGARVEELVNDELAADRAVEVSFLPRGAALEDEDLIRTKVNLIPESVVEIRVVDIVGLDKQADGGTHVRSTGEVGRIRVLKTENKGKGTSGCASRSSMPEPSEPTALAALRDILTRHDRLIVAFSGGADSAFLAKVAHDTLGRGRVRAVTAVSPSLGTDELDDCRRLAAEWDLRWVTIETDEMERAAYRVNDGERCYHCKTALMDALEPLAAADGGAAVALGVNLDDLADHRPGQRAALERRAVFPLVDAGFTKAEVRACSRRFGSAHLGQARRRVPGLPRALRDRGVGARPVPHRSGRVGPAPPRLPGGAGPPLRPHRAHRGPRRRAGAGAGVPRRGGRGRPSRGLRVRHARPRRAPLREPQRRAGHGRPRRPLVVEHSLVPVRENDH